MSPEQSIWRRHHDVVWSTLLYGLLSCLFIITTGFGIYSFGPWRVYVVAAAAAVSLAATLLCLRWPPATRLHHVEPALLLLAFGALWGNWAWAGHDRLVPLLHVVLVAAGAGCAALAADRFRPGAPRVSIWPLFLTLAAALYVAVVFTVPSPHIDVWDQMNRAGRTLLAGDNPYAVPIPDFYQGKAWYGFDSPGFSYPPLVLGLATLGRALHLDVRLLLLACTCIGAALVRATALRSGWSPPTADLVGLLYLLVPRQSFVVKYAHSEPVTGCLIAAAFYLFATRREVLALVCLGLFASSKQYLAVLAPLLLLFCRTPRRMAWFALGAAAPWLPFLVWDPEALWNAAFRLHLDRPPRRDALTLNAWLIARGQPTLPRWLPLGSGLLVATLQGLRAATLTLPRLGLGIACTLLVTLLLSPQAFQNYYVLVGWILLCAVATTPAGARCS